MKVSSKGDHRIIRLLVDPADDRNFANSVLQGAGDFGRLLEEYDIAGKRRRGKNEGGDDRENNGRPTLKQKRKTKSTDESIQNSYSKSIVTKPREGWQRKERRKDPCPA